MNQLKIEVKKDLIYARLPGGEMAYVKFMERRGVIYLLETYTPPSYRGRGIAKALTEKALEYAESKKLKVKPVCSYAVHYFSKNRDKSWILEEE